MTQRVILVIGALVMVGLVVYVPCLTGYGSSAGHRWVWEAGRVNTTLLFIEIGVVGVVTWFLSLAFRGHLK